MRTEQSRATKLADRSAVHHMRESRAGHTSVCVGLAYDMAAQAPGIDMIASKIGVAAGAFFVHHINRIASAGIGSHYVATDADGREFDVTITPRSKP